MAKFSDCYFKDNENNKEYYVCNKKKFTKEEAIELAIEELGWQYECLEAITGYVRHGYYIHDDERCFGYYLEIQIHNINASITSTNKCECWVVKLKENEK